MYKDGIKVKKKSTKDLLEEKKNFILDDVEYRQYLKRSLKNFRTESNSKIETCNMKFPEYLYKYEQVHKFKKDMLDLILRKDVRNKTKLPFLTQNKD